MKLRIAIVAALLLGVAVFQSALPVQVSAATPRNADYCEKTFKGSSKETQKDACEKGYTGGSTSKDKDTTCRSLRGDNKKACLSGFDRGKKDVPSTGGVASDPNLNCGGGSSGVCVTNLPTPSAEGSQIYNLLSIVIRILGAVAVLVIVLSGLRMITAQGDTQQISKARNGILYAVIGLLVAIVAQSIVYFVLNKV